MIIADKIRNYIESQTQNINIRTAMFIEQSEAGIANNSVSFESLKDISTFANKLKVFLEIDEILDDMYESEQLRIYLKEKLQSLSADTKEIKCNIQENRETVDVKTLRKSVDELTDNYGRMLAYLEIIKVIETDKF